MSSQISVHFVSTKTSRHSRGGVFRVAVFLLLLGVEVTVVFSAVFEPVNNTFHLLISFREFKGTNVSNTHVWWLSSSIA